MAGLTSFYIHQHQSLKALCNNVSECLGSVITETDFIRLFLEGKIKFLVTVA